MRRNTGRERDPVPFVPPAPSAEDLLRLDEVIQRTRLGRSSIYKFMSELDFPAPLKMGKRAVRWRRGDVDQWCRSRPRASSLNGSQMS